MRAIETEYKGYKFRSRLEARWAVFFDVLGVKWQYEPEGYVLENGDYYLPDFLVKSPQGYKRFYEVKPQDETVSQKFRSFACSLDHWETTAALLAGDPYDVIGKKALSICPRCAFISPHYSTSNNIGSDYGRLGMGYACWVCDCDTPVGRDNAIEKGLIIDVEPYKGIILAGSNYHVWKVHVVNAAKIARQARFEHGEKPSGGFLRANG